MTAARKIPVPFVAGSLSEQDTHLEIVPVDVAVHLHGRDRLHLHLQVRAGEIVAASLKGSGCPALLKLMLETRAKLIGPLHSLPLPTGTDHSAILMRELLLRARGEWLPPYTEKEICHCRAVSLEKVDHAIVCGAHTAATIARKTSAGTSCGTCRSDTEAMIAYRLKYRLT
jgi:bacterioferritin-associated ferredoxin